jgi:hypothetical protein
MIKNFFLDNSDEPIFKDIPENFIIAIENLYGFTVLQEVKEAIYYYNEKQITTDILNYLYAINFEIGTTERCIYTNEMIEITEDFFKNFEIIFLGTTASEAMRKNFRKEIHADYVTRTIAQEIKLLNKKIEDTTLFKNLFERYTRNLKENALAPYTENDNFRRALLDFNTPSFENNDERIKRDIIQLISQLQLKFKYSLQGAKEVSLYVIDKKLVYKY